MKLGKYILSVCAAVFCLLSFNCSPEKLDLDKITSSEPVKIGNLSDTVYIKLNPDWTDFNRPEDIIIGREPFIYVADTYNDQIVMMNISGQVLGKRQIKHPVALAQDYLLNLIVCAQLDTVIQGTPATISAVYKIDMPSGSHIIENARMTRILPLDNDFRYIDEIKRREYTGVCAFYDNSFYVSRKGPVNSNTFDPDNTILMFKKVLVSGSAKKDSLIGTVPYLASEGTGLGSANNISSLTSFNKHNTDIIVTLTGNNSFKVQWFHFVETSIFTGYQSQLSPVNAKMMQVNRFITPEDAAIDNSGNIFIADAVKDSVFKFNAYGEELQSFGGPKVFQHPHAVAFFDRTLYVVDTDNNRILRFILSTDIN